jgi:hypothetical protein
MDKQKERKKDSAHLDPNCDIGCVCLICASWSGVWSNSKTLGGVLCAQIVRTDVCRLGKKKKNGKVASFDGPSVAFSSKQKAFLSSCP